MKLNRKQEIVTAGEFIMLNRRREGWSQRELAKKSGLSAACIQLLESGQSINPTVKTIMALSTTINDVIGWDLFTRFETEQVRAGMWEDTYLAKEECNA